MRFAFIAGACADHSQANGHRNLPEHEQAECRTPLRSDLSRVPHQAPDQRGDKRSARTAEKFVHSLDQAGSGRASMRSPFGCEKSRARSRR